MQIKKAAIFSHMALFLSLTGLGANPEQADFFESKIRPLLSDHCFGCHGPKLQQAGLDLSTAEGVLRGIVSGPVIVKGDPENSRLIQAVRYLGKIKMPPTGKLSDRQIADLITWVQMGAPWSSPESKPAGVPAHEKTEFTSEEKGFWSFQHVRSYNPPPVRRKAWVKTPIDNFILSKLEKSGIAPTQPADKVALIRRATFDVTGLPPTEMEIKEFLADRSPQAFAKVVKRLLASPRYGECWGRHWLDVARYGDSTGGDEDFKNPHAWRYRDYVIEAFNRDLPYDQFIREQLAGDLLPAKTPGDVNTRGIVATGFLALGPKLLSEQDKPKVLYDMIDEQIDVVSRGIMGLTVACARCHDHKFDPIPTRDYYSLAAIFANTKQLKKLEGITSEMYFVPLCAKDEADRYDAHQEKIAAKKKEIDEIVDAEARGYAARLQPRLADYMRAARAIYEGGASAPELAPQRDL